MNAVCKEFKRNKKEFFIEEWTECETDQNAVEYRKCDIVPFVCKSSFFNC